MRGAPAVPIRRRTSGTFPFRYFIVAFAFTWTCWWLAVLDERGVVTLSIPVVPLGAFGPLVAAVVVTAHESGRAGLRALINRVLRWRVAPLWYAVALLGPPVVYLAAAALHVLAGGRSPTVSGLTSVLPTVLLLTVYFVVVAGLGEEVGWRGYALPALQARYNAFIASVILGVLWALWHLPLFFNPAVGTYSHIPFALYVAYMIPFTILITWVFNSARGSVLIVMILHGAMNAAGELMKAVPEFSGPPATAVEAAAETGRVYLLLTGVLAITAAAVVLVHGPRTLAGRHADLADFQASRTLGIGDEQQRRAGVPPVA